MKFISLDALPDDVRAELLLLEREGEMPDGCGPFNPPDDDFVLPDEE